jgi:hypothetical protein
MYLRVRRQFRLWASALGCASAVAAICSVDVAHAQTPEIDPPARVGRLSELTGQVWYYSPDVGEWVSAVPNGPLTTGDRVATDPGARVEVQVGSTTLRVDSSSELEVIQLDEDHLAAQLHEGTASVRVRDMAGAGQVELTSDEGRFVVQRVGTYRLDRVDGKSDITVYSGQARYEGPNSGLTVDQGQRAEFWIDSGGIAQYTMHEPESDSFADWNADRDRADVIPMAQRYVSPEMTGEQDLDAYGRWEQSPDYGAIWVPTAVAVDWSPYSAGHWAWVRPWGWTWIDDAPWGFAPFHFGRWVHVHNNWCWTPGARVARPVYAPALVAWVGAPQANMSAVGGAPAVGWFALGPREVYVPGYRVSPRYARNINASSVSNVAQITAVFNNPQAPREFVNRREPRAITVVPAAVMTERRPVAAAAAQFRQAPWVRELATQPAKSTALLAPLVAAPALPPRNRDPRSVQPPPGRVSGAQIAPPDRQGGAGRTAQPTQGAQMTLPGQRPAPSVQSAPAVTAPATALVPRPPGRAMPGTAGATAPNQPTAPSVQPMRPDGPATQQGQMRALPVYRGDDRRPPTRPEGPVAAELRAPAGIQPQPRNDRVPPQQRVDRVAPMRPDAARSPSVAAPAAQVAPAPVMHPVAPPVQARPAPPPHPAQPVAPPTPSLAGARGESRQNSESQR